MASAFLRKCASLQWQTNPGKEIEFLEGFDLAEARFDSYPILLK